jgi:hypothetical protein
MKIWSPGSARGSFLGDCQSGAGAKSQRNHKEPLMFVNQPWFKPALTALWVACLGIALSASLYSKHQFVAVCHTQLGELQLIDARTAETETQLGASEAALDAAEAQLDKAKR